MLSIHLSRSTYKGFVTEEQQEKCNRNCINFSHLHQLIGSLFSKVLGFFFLAQNPIYSSCSIRCTFFLATFFNGLFNGISILCNYRTLFTFLAVDGFKKSCYLLTLKFILKLRFTASLLLNTWDQQNASRNAIFIFVAGYKCRLLFVSITHQLLNCGIFQSVDSCVCIVGRLKNKTKKFATHILLL